MREGPKCIPRNWMSLSSDVLEHRKDREEVQWGWRGRRKQVLEGWGSSDQGFIWHSEYDRATGGLQTGKT